ncbi:potassium-transporting ATPase subunit KdpA [Enterococcus rivorum]|uniref:Potassium-transporting ATPase potassium-binding subunit n=1 Tax=Enterococcus rivorum TaxID=762845 RepID=A0A1E5KZ00_9ENTE|nr:potassium-transporting ATPase subunit KdpA [Enterococcus rivorum]MBP2097646.1 K+-transporting ATPase ATPase A chain [Enterococcus rivorum]OEH83087.1 potassium-transporting ATPase subunit A [Enterococcus rivorum]
MNQIFVEQGLFLVVLMILAIPLGFYIYKVMTNQKTILTALISPIEKKIYRFLGPLAQKEMNVKQYSLSVLFLSLFSFILLMAMMMFQHLLPLNPDKLPGTSLSLAFNTAASFVTNTNWQAYAGEKTMSIFTQAFGLTVQNFVSAAVGIAVLFVVLRGFTNKNSKYIGNFWQDLTKIILYVLLPVSLIVSVLLISQGVVQSFAGTISGTSLNAGEKIFLPLGTVASQVAIKQLGTNGGGYFGANSTHPFENPNLISNFIENLSILLLPAALIVAFGLFVKDWKQGRTIMIVSLGFLIAALIGVTLSEYYGPNFTNVLGHLNLEGKETRFGIGWSSLWAVSTTAVSNGSVNAMMDSFTPLGGLLPMFLMQLGEIIFGGAGSGLYGMIAFILLTIFIAGLLVGRTPEYLGKKIEPYDMKMVCLVILTPLLLTLLGTMSFILNPQAMDWLNNQGAHGFSEILYSFSSLANNNGSAFAGLTSDTTFLNIIGGSIMILSRFIPMLAVIFLAGNLGKKKIVATGSGTLSTTNGTFVSMLIIVILVVGALSFLPSMALGPIAEYFVTK